MIDYVKFLITNPDIDLLERKLDFYDNINTTTGEIKTINTKGQRIIPHKKATCTGGLMFKIYTNGIVTLSGSLHKYWNNGKHNYNDFCIKAVSVVLKELNKEFNITPKQCKIKCLEVGINLNLPFSVDDVINYSFLHKTNPLEHVIHSGAGNYKQAMHQQYIIKIYNKSLQYKEIITDKNLNLLRFEIKYKGVARLKKMGIYTLQNLLDYGLQNFESQLSNEWDNVLFFDKTTRINSLGKKDKASLKNYCNNLYWIELINKGQNENFKYHRKRLDKLTNEHSNRIKEFIKNEISNKIKALTSPEIKTKPVKHCFEVNKPNYYPN